jgi:thioredoxin 1
MSAVKVITKENFNDEVMNSEKPVLLDFWAEWCSHCRALAPTVDQVAEETPSVKVGKVNIDGQQELARQFGVRSIPTLVYLKNGQVIGRSVGAVPKKQILELIRN